MIYQAEVHEMNVPAEAHVGLMILAEVLVELLLLACP